MKKIFLIISLFILTTSIFALVCEPRERVSAKDFYIMPMSGEVSARDGEWECDEDYEDYYKDIYDAGFNCTGFVLPKKLELAKKYNLMINLEDKLMDKSIEDPQKRAEDWANKIKNVVPEDLKDYILRIYVRDEPTLADLPTLKIYCETIKRITGFDCYINLNPNYCPLDYLKANSYYEYADAITKGCNLDYVCYDNYSLDIDKGLEEDRFYSNLEEISKVADDNKVGFINIISSTAHFNYALPSEYSINVQVWSTLAYGGKGIAYFKWMDPQRTNYRGSAYDRFGNRTPTYQIIKNMNYALHNIGWCYTKLKHINTFHMGNVPKGSKGLESSKLIKDIFIDTRNLNLVIGEFTDRDNNSYIIVVNKDPKYSAEIEKLVFKKGTKLFFIEEYSNKNRRERPLDWEELKWIAPGRGILIKCTN